MNRLRNMHHLRDRARARDEHGVALVLAIVTLVVIAMMSTAILSLVTSGLNNRDTLDTLRNREYAAEAAIQDAITAVRQLADPGFQQCGPFAAPTFDGVAIHVDCINAPRLTTGFLKIRNVIFVACQKVGAGNGTTCDDTAADVRLHTIVRAQINFVLPPGSPSVTQTYVQSWSVNG